MQGQFSLLTHFQYYYTLSNCYCKDTKEQAIKCMIFLQCRPNFFNSFITYSIVVYGEDKSEGEYRDIAFSVWNSSVKHIRFPLLLHLQYYSSLCMEAKVGLKLKAY
eukprot:TRINITY_DN1095_c0_g2_i2.p9 TRINITY_DN1095_c0_g2~~TRINITY_DN1095_c0_g2_i2.p9  ORF type:complete len:106 (+),score=0.60 TRINITY_DN1095_c0_g2_i2:1109-1426(+)